jgi:hypothetical protein
VRYDLSEIAIAPNGEPIKYNDKPATFGNLLEFLLSNSTPKPEQKLEVYRVMQVVSGALENGEKYRELSPERVSMLRQLALDSPTLSTVACGVLHDWLGKDAA